MIDCGVEITVFSALDLTFRHTNQASIDQDLTELLPRLWFHTSDVHPGSGSGPLQHTGSELGIPSADAAIRPHGAG